MRQAPVPRRKVNRAALPEVLSVPEVAEVLGKSPEAVRQIIRGGRLRAGRIGRSLYVRKEWLFEALEPRPAPGPAQAGGAA